MRCRVYSLYRTEEQGHCSLNYTPSLGPDHQPPSHSSLRSVSLCVPLRLVCSSLAEVALRASASALVRVLSRVSFGFRRAVPALSSPPRASASLVDNPWSTVIVCGPGLPPSSKLIGFTVSKPISLLFPYFFRFLFLSLRETTICCRSLDIRGCSWSSDGDVQPLWLVFSRSGGNNIDPRHSVLSVPCLSLYYFDYCGATLSMSEAAPIHCLAKLSVTRQHVVSSS